MFMKTSVPPNYKFLILVWMIPDFYFGKKLLEYWKVYKRTDRTCNSGKLYIQRATSCRDFVCVKHLEGINNGNQEKSKTDRKLHISSKLLHDKNICQREQDKCHVEYLWPRSDLPPPMQLRKKFYVACTLWNVLLPNHILAERQPVPL